MGDGDPGSDQVLAKVTKRLVPLLILLYILNYLDRTNISMAKFQLSKDLHFNEAVYGQAAGIFFLGYFLFEVPSNLILQRVGARLWISRIMISWGIISTSMMLLQSVPMFYILRFLLGVSEAGFFPGILLYLTFWIPASHRAKIIAAFLTSTALSGAIGNPLTGKILGLDKVVGMAGWQWVFFLEGLPSVLLGIAVLWLLPDRPDTASWLTPAERDSLRGQIRKEEVGPQRHGAMRLGSALGSFNVWYLCLVYGLLILGYYNFVFWAPTIIKERAGLTDDWDVGRLSALPYEAACLAMILVGQNSDRMKERRWHVATSCFVASAAFACCAAFTSSTTTMVALSFAAAGIWGTLGPFWALPSNFLGGTAAAAGIALINSMGNLSGYFGQILFGDIRQNHGTETALWLPSIALLAAGSLIVIRKLPDMPSSAADHPVS